MTPNSPAMDAQRKIIKRERPWSHYVEMAMANALPRHLTAGMIADAVNKLVGYPDGHPERLTHGNADSLLSDMAKQGRIRRLKERARNITGRWAQTWALAEPSHDDQLEAKETELRIQLAHAINKRTARPGRVALLKQLLALAAGTPQ